VCLSKDSLRSYIVRTMPRLKVFNDVIITDEERAPSPAAAAPAPMPSIVAVPIRDHLETFSDPQERSREKEETEAKTERERKSETDLGPRAGSGSAMCYPLRARDLDREEGDSLSHTAASSTSPRPSTPPIPRGSDTDTSADVATAADPQSLAQFGAASSKDADHPVLEESERIFKSMVLMYFRQVIHETVESLCPI
jgi:hypothetical protein